MKEMVKSKGIVAFIIFILGVTYFNASTISHLEQTTETENLVVMNH